MIDFSALKASFINKSLKKTPDESHTKLLLNASAMTKMLEGGIPHQGNEPEAWRFGTRLDFENPEYRG